MGIIFHIGRYTRFILRVLRKPENGAVFRRSLVNEMTTIGTNSIGIVTLLSLFMGAVINYCSVLANDEGSNWSIWIFRKNQISIKYPLIQK